MTMQGEISNYYEAKPILPANVSTWQNVVDFLSYNYSNFRQIRNSKPALLKFVSFWKQPIRNHGRLRLAETVTASLRAADIWQSCESRPYVNRGGSLWRLAAMKHYKTQGHW